MESENKAQEETNVMENITSNELLCRLIGVQAEEETKGKTHL